MSSIPGRFPHPFCSALGTQFWVSPAKHTIVVVMQQIERSPTSDLPWAPSVVQALAMP